MGDISQIKLPNNTTYNINAKTVNGHTVEKDVPSSAVFTDQYVTQVSSATEDDDYRVLLSGSADDSTRTEQARKATTLKFNPSTGTLTATKLISDISSSTGLTSTQVTTALGYTPYDSTNPNGYTNNIGTVTSVKVGTTSYSPSSGVVSLPAYPTSLPASDTVSTYSSTGTAPVNGKAVLAAIQTLDGTVSGSAGAGKTLTAFSQTDGKVSATFGNISITKSQVSDLGTIGTAASKAYTTSVTSGSSDLVTSGAVYSAIDALPEPMVFKGSLGTGGTITTLPTNGSASIGDTYKVITAGTYASKSAKVGDTFICLTKTSSANTWELIPSGDEPSGTVTSVGISNGGGLSVSGSPITSSGTITISHADTSSQASVNNSGRTYIQDITLDTYGHVTGISSATETVVNTDRYVNSAAFADATSADANNPIKMTLTRAGSDTASVTAYIPKVSSSSAGVAPKGAAVSSQSQSTKFLREDGTWAAPSYTTNTNTTYTLSADTTNNKITLTPSSGSAQSITVPYATSAGSANSATTASKLGSSNVGSATQPIYLNGGTATACTYTLGKSVPSDAVFTDHYAWTDITGKPSTFTPSTHYHYELIPIGDQRTISTTPNTYLNRLIFQGLKTQSYIGNPGGTHGYSYLLGLRGWSDSSGGDAHELAFNNNGIYYRHGATTTWNNWVKIFTSADTYTGTLTSSQVTTALGYTPTANTGTITSVKTTAGAHTTINVSSGAANFNVPTKTSHLTNDSGFVTTDEKVKQIPNTTSMDSHPILFSASDSSGEVVGGAYKNSNFYYRPDANHLIFKNGGGIEISSGTTGVNVLSQYIRLTDLDDDHSIMNITTNDIELENVTSQGTTYSNTWDGTHHSLKSSISSLVSKSGDTISGDYVNTADFSEGGITGTRVTTYGPWGIDVEEYVGTSLWSRLSLRDSDILLTKKWGDISTSLQSSIGSLKQSLSDLADKKIIREKLTLSSNSNGFALTTFTTSGYQILSASGKGFGCLPFDGGDGYWYILFINVQTWAKYPNLSNKEIWITYQVL